LIFSLVSGNSVGFPRLYHPRAVTYQDIETSLSGPNTRWWKLSTEYIDLSLTEPFRNGTYSEAVMNMMKMSGLEEPGLFF